MPYIHSASKHVYHEAVTKGPLTMSVCDEGPVTARPKQSTRILLTEETPPFGKEPCNTCFDIPVQETDLYHCDVEGCDFPGSTTKSGRTLHVKAAHGDD